MGGLGGAPHAAGDPREAGIEIGEDRMLVPVELAQPGFQKPLPRGVLVLLGQAHQDGQKTVIREDEAALLVVAVATRMGVVLRVMRRIPRPRSNAGRWGRTRPPS